jgi:probable F420-dependent oxidoreductase
MSLTIMKLSDRGLSTPFGGKAISLRLAATSAAVSGSPLWNLTPWRILKVQVLPLSVGSGRAVHKGGIRVERLAEAVTLIKGLLKGEQVALAGRHYHVTGHTIYPLPVQRPHPPILIGGNGRRLLTLAAREADIVGFSGITFRRGGAVPDISGWRVPEVDRRMQLVRDVAGERYARLELNALVQRVVVTDHPRQAAEELARRWTQLDPEEILQSPYVLIGTVDKLNEDLRARRERWGISYYVIFESYVDAFAPVVARLTGG